jgi:DNA primase
LVLIPDKEDPDSYVNKIGSAAFIEFIQREKKDFILFQLEISLQEAGNDSSKKSVIVNQIADTISRINKTEEFTRRQDYIKRVSEILKIEESGFNSLVNKIIRDKLSKEEFRSQRIATPPLISENAVENDVDLLFNKDELHEQAMVRSLIEFGLKDWDETQKVATYIFSQIDEIDLNDFIDNKTLVNIIKLYRTWFDEGLQPTEKSFLYVEDNELSSMALKILDVASEISPKWKKYYEGPILSREDLYKEEVESTLGYLQLRKIKRLMVENQLDLEKTNDPNEQIIYLQTHQHLKKIEIEITKKIGAVIIK